MKLRCLAPCLATAVTVLLQASAGAARPEFPGEMKDTMQLDCTPACLLCHTVEEGGAENLNQYGLHTISQGITVGGGPKAVFAESGPAAVCAEGADPTSCDFDSDGTSDRDEIILNTDPRTEEKVAVCSDAVYGCGAQVAPGNTAPASPWAALAALGVAAFLLRQLRRA